MLSAALALSTINSYHHSTPTELTAPHARTVRTTREAPSDTATSQELLDCNHSMTHNFKKEREGKRSRAQPSFKPQQFTCQRDTP